MNMHCSILVALASSLVVVAGLHASQEAPDASLMAKAKAIHQRVLTIDTHVDIGGAEYATAALDPGNTSSNDRLQCNLPKMEAGGIDAVFLAVFTSQRKELNDAGYIRARESAMTGFDAIYRLTKMYPDRAVLARTPADVETIHKTGKRAILIGVENGYPVGENLASVQSFFDLGARYITLVHTAHNQIADSASPTVALHNGLSAFGKRVVPEMNRMGVMIDVSHASAKAFWDILQITTAPIIATHSGCSGLNPHPRNLDDSQLVALAKNGGVIQIVALTEYLRADSPERVAALHALRAEVGLGAWDQGGPEPTAAERAELEKKYALYHARQKEVDAKFPGATVKDFVDHIDHAVRIAGIDHVGVGTDFDGGGGIPGFNDHAEALNVTVELVRRGYTEDQIAKIWGGNLMRAWRAVEKAAGR